MTVELDLTQLVTLRELYGHASTQWHELLDGLIQSLGDVVQRIEHAVSDGDSAELARAAHLGRNDALLVGARGLLEPLTQLELAARAGTAAELTRPLAELRATWPSMRAELERLAEEDEPR